MAQESTPTIAQATASLPVAGVATYEQALSRDSEWALTEGSLFFEGRGKVQETLKRITVRWSSSESRMPSQAAWRFFCMVIGGLRKMWIFW